MQIETHSLTQQAIHLSGGVLLDHLGIIKIEGEDAAKFIHGQLTQDFSLLGTTEARLAALCSPKGRMLASFIGYKDAQGTIFLLCSKDLLAATLKRLSMFVMRAKARLSDASNQHTVYGLAGDAVLTTGAAMGTPWAKADLPNAAVAITLHPAAGAARQLWIGSANAAPPAVTALSKELWHWSEVQSGVATLSAPLADQFVPQMLNFESVGGVSFKKGCYPGQEVVARSQFRGTIKRRAFIVHCEACMQPADTIYAEADPTQECGLVLQCAPAPQGGFDAIISAQVLAIKGGQLHLSAPDGPKLSVLTLAYDLIEDI